ncbi:MAG: restriction endonuclease subunit S [Candidatus Dormibacteria bacterium]
MNWPTVKLGDHADLLTGFPFKSGDFTTDPQGVRLLRGANVAQARLNWDDLRRLPVSLSHTYPDYELRSGDVILAMDRPWIEAGLKYAWITAHDLPTLLVQRVSRIRGKNGLITDYLRYVIGSSMFTDYISPIVTGATVPHISPTQIREFRFQLPPASTQRKIAAVLSVYDDLIDNNSRRIKALEEMAQRIYGEWFIDFRYPGREGARLADSRVGPIPEGWGVVRLGDWASVVVGSTPSRTVPEYWRDGDIAWINSSQINDLCVIEATETISRAGYESTSTKMMPVGTTLVAITGATLGQVSYLSIPACGSQNVSGIYSEDPDLAPYIYHTVVASIGNIANRAMGGAQQHINRGIVQETLVCRPDSETLASFCKLVRPIVDEIVCLLREQKVVREARNLLLPRLVSGEIDAGDLDIAISDAVA